MPFKDTPDGQTHSYCKHNNDASKCANCELEYAVPKRKQAEKAERLDCPFCNPNTPYGASPMFFDQWKIKHEYH